MRLAPLLPQPFRNIYNNINLLKGMRQSENRAVIIDRIVRDVMKLLIAIPLAPLVISIVNPGLQLATSIVFLTCLPESYLLSMAGGLTYLAVALLVHSVTVLSPAALGLSTLCAVGGYYISEYYDRIYCGQRGLHLQDKLIAPISNKIALAFA